MQKHTVTRKK